MTFQKPQTLKSIAELIGAKMIGSEDFEILGTNEIHRVKSGEIVFVNHPKYYEKALHSAATIILIDKEVDCPQGKALLVSDDPFRDFNVINKHFGRKYESILLDLINGVFAECLTYDTQRAEKDGVDPILPKLVEIYPNYARHFLNSLKVVSTRGR